MVADLNPVGRAWSALKWWIVVGCLCGQAAAQSFSARWESDTVGAGENAVLQLIFTDCGNVAQPNLPPIPNATVRYTGASQQLSIVNGASSSSIIHRFNVTPKSAGTVTIPALTVEVDGVKLTSKPITLRVGQGFDPSQIGQLSVEVPKTEWYVGETVPIAIRFQYRTSPVRQEPPSLKMDGFLKGRQSSPEGHSENINGESVSVAKWAMAVTAVKAGDLDLGPAEFPTLYIFQNRRRQGGPFDDPFFGQFFGGGGEQRQITFQSEPVHLRVLSPPTQGRPPQYNGAVGKFSMEVTASPTTVTAGDPVTVRVLVKGRGNFDGLRLPDLPPDSGFQAYPGTNSFDSSDPLGLEGVKVFEEVLVPERGNLNQLTLPPLAFWNPATKEYGLAEARPIPLVVKPSLAVAVPGGPTPAALSGTNSAVATPAVGLRPLKTDLGSQAPWQTSWLTEGWYYTGLSLPPGVVLAVLFVQWWQRRPRDQTAANRAERMARVNSALALVERVAAEGNAKECYEAAHQALQEQLGLVLGRSSGAFTQEIIDAVLVPRGLEEIHAVRLRALFDAAAHARFGAGGSASELASVLKDTRSVVDALKKLEVGK